jgi:hypothetical protein
VSTAPLTQSTAGPLAVGDLFILTREYLGLPEDLGVSTPRFLAQSERIEDGRYVFAPSVTLAGRTKYWFYSRWAPGSAGTVSPITGFSEDTYAGGDMYIAPSSEAESRRFPSEKHRRAGV